MVDGVTYVQYDAGVHNHFRCSHHVSAGTCSCAAHPHGGIDSDCKDFIHKGAIHHISGTCTSHVTNPMDHWDAPTDPAPDASAATASGPTCGNFQFAAVNEGNCGSGAAVASAFLESPAQCGTFCDQKNAGCAVFVENCERNNDPTGTYTDKVPAGAETGVLDSERCIDKNADGTGGRSLCVCKSSGFVADPNTGSDGSIKYAAPCRCSAMGERGTGAFDDATCGHLTTADLQYADKLTAEGYSYAGGEAFTCSGSDCGFAAHDDSSPAIDRCRDVCLAVNACNSFSVNTATGKCRLSECQGQVQSLNTEGTNAEYTAYKCIDA
jgi:hypothetical protein